MSCKVETLDHFDKQLKRLSKKYSSLRSEYEDLLDLLETTPGQGTPIGSDCYKLRLAIASKGKGKSGGARVIYFMKVSNELIVLLSIYDKSEKENITDKELYELLAKIS